MKPLEKTNTIFGGLKLTETLYNELKQIKQLFDQQTDKVESGNAERDFLKKNLKELSNRYILQKKTIGQLKAQLNT